MPTYEYKREDGSTFEFTQKMSDKPLEICPTTGQSVKRVISGGGGVLYKGDGFYITDYKNAGKNESDAAPKTEKTENPSKSETKSEE